MDQLLEALRTSAGMLWRALWVLVGWRFTLANFLLGTVMIVYANC